MFFHVYVKRATRKGSEILVDRVVEFEGNRNELSSIMANNYQGLIVECSEIQKVQKVQKVSPKLDQPASDELQKKITKSKLQINVALNAEESALHDIAWEAREKFDEAVQALNSAVKGRYQGQLKDFGYIDDLKAYTGPHGYSQRSACLMLNNSITEFEEKISQDIELHNNLK